jgi:hypothetical protein
MIGALIEMDDNGRVRAVYIIANNDREEATVEHCLARITSAGAWAWLRRLFRRRR